MLPAAICASCQARFLLFAVLLIGSSSASPGQEARTGFANQAAWTAGRASAIFSFAAPAGRRDCGRGMGN